MYLEKLEIQGFKSFAHKMTLVFPKRGAGAKGNKPGIAAVVGPNGSGKSNIADAIRWVLGEQSMKLLRGKKTEDVIFSGSEKKARAGFAQVSLYLNNEDRSARVDYAQVVVTRRIFRDGTSEYLLNNNTVRLADVQLLLAQAHFGHRTYSVIGQGMVDAILASSAFERKEFFDEATGVKQYQIKREHAQNKLVDTEKNVQQIHGLLREVTPRLATLSRQIKRLEKRVDIEKKLHELQVEHYGAHWHVQTLQHRSRTQEHAHSTKQYREALKKLRSLQGELSGLEKKQAQSSASQYEALEQQYREAMRKKSEREKSLAEAEYAHKLAAKTDDSAETHIPSKKLMEMTVALRTFLKKIMNVRADSFAALQQQAGRHVADIDALLSAPRNDAQSARDQSHQRARIKQFKGDIAFIAKEITHCEQRLTQLRAQESHATSEVFTKQRQYQKLQEALNTAGEKKNAIEISLARLDAHRHDLKQEIEQELSSALREAVYDYTPHYDAAEDHWPRIAKLKHELEMIGGIDPETEKEYHETKKRHDFLEQQLHDLNEGLKKTKELLSDLDTRIDKEFTKNFTKIEKGFSEYFAVLFNGGKASLAIQKESALDNMKEEELLALTEEETQQLKRAVRTGIEIKASPPGKKVSTVNILSGGERALTSIALICAIIKANPSPFVVLDEVDAALDEANSERFAQILERLANETQFIAITHNRATMERASTLYGVTMGDDSISKLLSIDLEKAVQASTT